jgi:hypothetical protein
VVSQPFPRSARLPKTRENRPEIRAFRAFGCVSGLPVRPTCGGNRRKSPATSQIFPFCGDYRRRLVRSRLPPEAGSKISHTDKGF